MILTMENFMDKNEMYAHLDSACAAVIDRRDDVISSLANASALIKMYLADTNWVGFYLYKEEKLMLGPFQGAPAVTNIKMGKGVCGSAAENLKTMRIGDVKTCDNYIACDDSSASEIVIPLVKKGRLIGVLDIDSPVPERFDAEDEKGLEKIAASLVRLIYM
ncbi:MAG: GAF domain-containing protein [Synergistaceae bacterium]|jgi:GAF domain-containing protein|nr:GAF domain-containing protein [Synergistaceae bacterium]